MTESLLNQGMSDSGSLCETLAERREQNHDECLTNKTKNAGEVGHTTLTEPSVSDLSDSLFLDDLFLRS